MEVQFSDNPIYSTITQVLNKAGVKGEFEKYDKTQRQIFSLKVQGILTDGEADKAFRRLCKKITKDSQKLTNN